jgi:hypothetical protein
MAEASKGTLIAVNQADSDISIVDAQAAKEVARVPEGRRSVRHSPNKVLKITPGVGQLM